MPVPSPYLIVLSAEEEAVLAARARSVRSQSRQLHPPRPGHPVVDLSQERIKRRAVLGGLIGGYERAA